MFDKKMIVSVATAIVVAVLVLHALGYIAMKMGIGPMKHRGADKMMGEKAMMTEDGDKMEGDAMMEAEVSL